MKSWEKFRSAIDELSWGTVVSTTAMAMIVLASMLSRPPSPAALAGSPGAAGETLEGRVLQILSEERTPAGPSGSPGITQKLLVEITKGSRKGHAIEVQYGGVLIMSESRLAREGDRVLIEHGQGPAGESFYISDFMRLPALLLLALCFSAAAIIVGRKTGLRSLISMSYTVAIIALFILPRLGAGQAPVMVCIAGALLAVVPSLYLTYGWNWKTHSALPGLTISLLMTALLATLFANWSRLTGFASEEAALLLFLGQTQIDLRGLALGGIIIGTLGVLDDVTIGQASATFELKRANPALDWRRLYHHGMVVGRDHIASMINTLMMAYVGAALPLLLLMTTSSASLGQTLNREFLAEEIIRTLVGSLGLILAVPITSLIASLIAHRHVKA